MKNRRAFIVPLSLATIALTSCGLLENTPWSWEKSTNGFKINYCLLIGQIDHNDSMYRTRGTREILDTRVEEKYQKTNFNLEGVKKGKIKLNEAPKDPSEPHYPYDENVDTQEYSVTELESLEQKSFSGATWDPITANSTASTWINKHDKNITLFVSNNDGMAEGAMKAYNWKKGMPIFGYDSNMSTLRLMKEKEASIKGTIDSNTVGQCLVTSVIIRNIYQASKSGLIKKMWDEKKIPYNPIYEGFQYDDEAYAKEASDVSGQTIKQGDSLPISYGTGHVKSTVTFDGCLNNDLTKNNESHHAILLKNRSVTNDKYTATIDPSAIETDYFFDKDGNELKPNDLYKKAEGGEDSIVVDKAKLTGSISTCQTWYSKTDTFFTGNMNPYFEISQSKDQFDISVDYPYPGDGSDEKVILDSLDTALGHGADKGPQAFLINPVQQSNSLQYIKKIADAYKLKEKDNWIDRSDIPVIFWNRQPTDIQGNISSKDVMNNKYFKYTYYVGFDAKQGGELQGQMIRSWLNKTYIEKAKEGK